MSALAASIAAQAASRLPAVLEHCRSIVASASSSPSSPSTLVLEQQRLGAAIQAYFGCADAADDRQRRASAEAVLAGTLADLILSECRESLRAQAAPAFWAVLANTPQPDQSNSGAIATWLAKNMQAAFAVLEASIAAHETLFEAVLDFAQSIPSLSAAIRAFNVNTEAGAIVFARPLPEFAAMVEQFVTLSYWAHAVVHDDVPNDWHKRICDDVPEEAIEALQQAVGAATAAVFSVCQRRKLQHRVLMPFVLSQLDILVKAQTEAMANLFADSCHEAAGQWIDTYPAPWLRHVLGESDECDQLISYLKTQWLSQSLAALRTTELFDIIVDYPESANALSDLRALLIHPQQRAALVQTLRASFERRLLHPGANTPDILTQYISAIRALRQLDESGVILEQVCAPVREYLFGREDTIRCIVSSLVDDAESDLRDELANTNASANADSDVSDTEDATDSWNPVPLNADLTQPSSLRKTSDIISLLISIYGSKERFVDEYRALLSDRLISTLSYDIDKELRNLELLKLRFGEANMLFSEVMLRDITESKRNNTSVQERMPESVKLDFPLNVIILSRLYWPNFKTEPTPLPKPVEDFMKAYEAAFEILKPTRALHWKHSVGIVTISLDFEDGELEFSVAPAMASLIMLFERDDPWTLGELVEATESSTAVVRKRLAFWIAQRVVIESPADTFSVISKIADQGVPLQGIDADSDEEDALHNIDGEAGEEAEGDEELDVTQCFMFVSMMLTNLGSLPADRMLTMMGMYAPTMPIDDRSFRRFLSNMVADGKLATSGGEYQLVK
ncbi:anaphase-promoting complex subunit 2 [Capsaspora owczarzaki ATCC 30864]|uniref:Anaphase-promoting complex subunit 2 n=1 Tax=Capsaspora owczarzaki (strain ATCC 30864) TaxID=595528 RepID=A0A0D2WNK1_CAPO3|nr:anaphase-promoting complex subunit 2 [Capsaspora owczarzaki ATCC 30864]KJE91988.1 anaphase-promoting complex subunit 2 [Capsaspora owczarzaki ATCC 30864]|eukprot:XP_004363869.2 anaphase-promoting complex subunit 2 [Capsaspora owczarzaki ATCC 30864]